MSVVTKRNALFQRLPGLLRHPLAAGAAGGLVTAGIVIALLASRDGGLMRWEPDAEAMTTAMAEIRAGGTGTVASPYGDITMGLGRRPGVADPDDAGWFWHRIEGADAAVCEALARGYLDRPDIASLRVGPVLVTESAPEGLASACAAHGTVSVVMAFGETL